jgi:diacylglycerol kinase (ATP)
MPEASRGGVGRLARAFVHALRGLRATLRHELAFRVEICVAALAIPVALWLGESPVEQGLLIAVAGLIPLVELVNAAIETTVDRISPEHHPLSGRAKDQAAAALLAALGLAALVWLVVLLG